MKKEIKKLKVERLMKEKTKEIPALDDLPTRKKSKHTAMCRSL